MIKVGIAGADTPIGGELMRLCLHHPDVEIATAYAPAYSGRNVTDVHRGFIGEPRIIFTSNFDATTLDVAFVVKPVYTDSDWSKFMSDRPNLRLILFPGSENLSAGLPTTPIYGLSEIFRKPMVRGAREAIVPNPVASAALVALYPLARHLLLSDSIDINLVAPADIIEDNELNKGLSEIKEQLKEVQTSFKGDINVRKVQSDNPRSMELDITLKTGVDVDEIIKIYDSIYDDHNFSFVVKSSVTPADVESTDKVLISVSRKDSSTISLKVVADPRMRGGAGEAIHIMNLFFGLHEKTGLDLRSTAWCG